jgi:hypothetical protein
MSRNAVILPDLATYQQYLSIIESVVGSPWQPADGCTDGTDYALVIPEDQDALIPATFPRTKNFQNYSLTVPQV